MLARIVRRISEFLDRDDGPTAVEYAVMLALIIVVCVSAISALGSNANRTFMAASNAAGRGNSGSHDTVTGGGSGNGSPATGS